MRRVITAVLVGCIAAMAVPAIASAGPDPLTVELVSPVEPLTFTATVNGFTCDSGTIQVSEVLDDDNNAVTPISVTEDPTDPNTAIIVLPSDTVAGSLGIVAACVSGEFPVEAVGGIVWASIAVSKVVAGAVPADARFTVHADCVAGEAPVVVDFGNVDAAALPDDFGADIAYGATGGVGYVYTDHYVVCTLTEPENGGATSVTITPSVLDLVEPGNYEATVTNTFAIELEPTFTG